MYWYIIICVQIVLETLPVSSSGHLLLLEHFLLCFTPLTTSDLVNGVLVSQEMLHIMHVPTLLILALFFGFRWYNFLRYPLRLWRYFIAAFLFTTTADSVTILFYFLKPRVSAIYLPLGFASTLIALASLYWCPVTKTKPLKLNDAVIIGLVQAIALLPGISRLASVFVTTRWLGYTNRQAFEVAWMIQVPLIAAAATKGLLHLYKQHELVAFCDWHLWITIAIATLLSWYTLRLCSWLVKNNKVWWCSIYMIIPLFLSIVSIRCR